jgi:two-component system sensor histidine kinase HydH
MLGALDTAHSEALRRSQLAFLGEIAGNIAHEVRTPLSTLKAAAQLVGNPGVAPDRQQRLLESIVSEVDRLNRVVTDLVDIARPATASYRPEPVGPVVARAVSLFAAAADTASVQLQYDAAPEPLVVRGSSDRLYQTLVNLIRNAMQAVGESGTVTVRSRRHGDTVVLEIEDSGPGVPPDMLPKIFSPFVTMKPDGAGLGLAIARRIVEEHGGTISVENREDVGARFTIRLPLTDDTA